MHQHSAIFDNIRILNSNGARLLFILKTVNMKVLNMNSLNFHMRKFDIDFEGASAPILDRVMKAYGFTAKADLADHLGIAPSTLSGRYRRGGFPADIVTRCMAETGVSLDWLATGHGDRVENEALDVLNFPRMKLIDGQLFKSGNQMFDKSMFQAGVNVPKDPACVIDGRNQYVVDLNFAELSDGVWLVSIEGKTSFRILTRIPIKKVRVSGVGMAFDCGVDDIEVLGQVIMTCITPGVLAIQGQHSNNVSDFFSD